MPWKILSACNFCIYFFFCLIKNDDSIYFIQFPAFSLIILISHIFVKNIYRALRDHHDRTFQILFDILGTLFDSIYSHVATM